MRRIPLQIAEDKYHQVKELARLRYMTMTGLLRQLIDRELAAAKAARKDGKAA